MTVAIEATGVRAVVDPARGARLVSLEMAGLEVLGRADDNPGFDPVIDEGCYPMVPWAGRIRDGLIDHGGTTHALPTGPDGHALHGLGKDAAWTQVDDDTFSAALGEPWPAPGEATLRYEPRDHGLRITLSWRSDHELGCSLGIHPWFRRRLTHGRGLEATLAPTSMIERGADGLPTGQLVPPGPHPWDDCFRLVAPPVLEWPGALRLTLTSTADWWVVYDAPADALCVEPQTAPPDAFAHRSLQPHDGWPRTVVLDIGARPLS